MRPLLALLVLCGGCLGGSFTERPGQAQATDIVWHHLYGEDGDAPPVEWFDDADGVLFSAAGGDYAGLTLPGWKVQVAWRSALSATNGGPFIDHGLAESAFAHELMHYHTYLRTGDVDAAHWRGDWDLADHTARAALYDAGL